ncbi:hypothetical protein CsatA_003644 [Cannabis sativa]
MALKNSILILFQIFLCFELPLLLHSTKAQSWIRAGYWRYDSDLPSSEIDSTLFTHLIYAFADLNSSSFELSIASSTEEKISTFTETVKKKNPLITTLLSIGGGNTNFSEMVSSSSHRKSFIDSSIKVARLYGFQGLDFSWHLARTSLDMRNMGTFFQEWRNAASSEPRNSCDHRELILTSSCDYAPSDEENSCPVDSINRYLDWIYLLAYDYHTPLEENITGAHAALYDRSSNKDTAYGILVWRTRCLSSSKMVMALPYYGYAWTLLNPADNGVGAPATGPAVTQDGLMSYKQIKSVIKNNSAQVKYNSTYVVNYCSYGSTWIGFDDVKAVKQKISHAKKTQLRGYVAWHVANDDNWMLSSAAKEEGSKKKHKARMLLTILLPIATVILLIGALMYYCLLRRKHILNAKVPNSRETFAATSGDFQRNDHNLKVYSLEKLEAATKGFSIENKLGEGGYGPVYKGVLSHGQEIAVKKLSTTSTQGYEEFMNEVELTAKLQHVNLVRVLGFCIEHEEQMLIYEYMRNKSLDLYLFDPLRRFSLNWRKRVDIIEGVTQGLLYLQEYSRLTIIHRDLKSSNILIDDEMKPKISDFGMARIFTKDVQEANTGRIVGTYGYISPEYVKEGLYSTKTDVYSFGVLVLQIISGKRNAYYYGSNENMNFLEYAYELWKEGKQMEFMDPSLDDTHSSCKVMKCMQIALLCVQEEANDRPSMLEVSSMLRSETAAVAVPKMPAFSRIIEDHHGNYALSRPNTSSVNNATVTELVPR